ncbi:hypothetical protein N9N28_02000 [Rubripirellula amarantea]|nr:hypothetical protein [Rubripirellula amarantea]
MDATTDLAEQNARAALHRNDPRSGLLDPLSAASSITPVFGSCGFWVVMALLLFTASPCLANGGILNFSISDEVSDAPLISRCELWRPDRQRGNDEPGSRKTLMPVRKTVPAGLGFVIDRSSELALPDGNYQFRLIRGPEYRIIRGSFTLEKTSLDDHHVGLPRMVDMFSEGWVSGDAYVPASDYSWPLRMASEDLHLIATDQDIPARAIPGRDPKESVDFEPAWTLFDASIGDGLVVYGKPELDPGLLPVERILKAKETPGVKVAIENPFAWPLPVWLATESVDGHFVLGDWLRLDKDVMRVRDGRPTQALIKGDAFAVGRWAETIYHHMLECGLTIPPLAGSGDDSGKSPIGYNRIYATVPMSDAYGDQAIESPRAPTSSEEWWRTVWSGHSVATNGPCLRVSLGGKLPGHTFHASTGEVLQLRPELRLAVRDPVEYLDVIHNGKIFYSAKLDEFAKAGGVIPLMNIKESGWVMIRVVTGYEGHFRAAMSAPWYVVFDGQPRVNQQSVDFFQLWLKEYEARLRKMPDDEIARHVPHVQRARKFWNSRATYARP